MPKPIKATAHGVLDWLYVALMLGVPVAMGFEPRARYLSWVSAASMGSINAVTDHPVAIRRVISMRTHGWLELAALPLLIGVPVAAGAVDEPRARRAWLALLGMTVPTYFLTDWDAAPDS